MSTFDPTDHKSIKDYIRESKISSNNRLIKLMVKIIKQDDATAESKRMAKELIDGMKKENEELHQVKGK